MLNGWSMDAAEDNGGVALPLEHVPETPVRRKRHPSHMGRDLYGWVSLRSPTPEPHRSILQRYVAFSSPYTILAIYVLT